MYLLYMMYICRYVYFSYIPIYIYIQMLISIHVCLHVDIYIYTGSLGLLGSDLEHFSFDRRSI